MRTSLTFNFQYLPLFVLTGFLIFNIPLAAQIPLVENISLQTANEPGTTPVLVASSYSFTVNDTVNVDSFDVLVGSYKDSSDLVNNNFSFDVSTGLLPNMTYYRLGNKVILTVADVVQKDTYYGRIIVHLSNNTQSDPFRFVGN